MGAKKYKINKFKKGIYNCERCGLCIFHYNTWTTHGCCPVGEHSLGFEPYFARGKVIAARGIIEGRIDYSPAFVDPVAGWCSTCGLCVRTCGCTDEMGEFAIVTPEIVEAMRADLVDLGMCPEAFKELGNKIQKEKNYFGAPKANRMKWTEGLNVNFLEAKKQ